MLIINAMAKRGDVKRFIDIDEPIIVDGVIVKPIKPIWPVLPTVASIKEGATTIDQLDANKQKDLAIKREDFKKMS